ncbi:hypothetical protein [Terrisporobacter sp.]|uniref:hypothetical protein n=1 Tax=Terrisporobacter sp. TaxID=1965305 RepID=UPI00289DE879|nr:hypothetical protein [Terrisporobacter sp.]
MKNINLESKISNFETQNDSRFINCKVIACHDGINKNNSSFDDEVQMRCAEKSIRGIPLLGHLFLNKETGKYELGGHDIDFDLIDTEDGLDVEIKHLERPFGFIRQDAPVEQEIIDGRRYVVSYGVIWKDYADQLLNIIDENDGNIDVSMEISVDDFHFDDSGVMVISNFTFNGITLLGVEPAMEGAKIRTYSMSDIKSELQEMMRQYSLEKGGEKMEEKVAVEVEEQTQFENEQVEETIEKEVETQDGEKFEEVVESETVEEKAEEINEFELLKSEHETLKESYSILEVELKELQEKYSDYETLKEFKENYDRVAYEKEVEEVSKMFELDEEEIKELKEKALSKEINVEQFKEKLGFKFAMKQLANKKETKKEFSSEIQIIDDKENVQGDPYFESLLAKARNRK